jgi:PIN domain nuclease of toxin-antitoxin system
VILLDTHIVIWLFAGESDLLSRTATQLVETEDVFISPFVLLEMEYLFEVSRISQPARIIFGALQKELGLEIQDGSMHEIVQAALQEKWTRDPFDRQIVAQARLLEADLVTKDRNIRSHYSGAVW